MMEIFLMLLAIERPEGFAGIEVSGVAREGNDAGRKRRRSARTADARPAAVEADVHRNARRAARFRRHVADGAVGTVRVFLPGWLRNARTSDFGWIRASRAGVGPEGFTIRRPAHGQLRAPDGEHAGEVRRSGDIIIPGIAGRSQIRDAGRVEIIRKVRVAAVGAAVATPAIA